MLLVVVIVRGALRLRRAAAAVGVGRRGVCAVVPLMGMNVAKTDDELHGQRGQRQPGKTPISSEEPHYESPRQL
jgi:hypothetical protein